MLATFVIALAATPIFRKIAKRYKVLAFPNHRTVHEGTIPKLGGGSIYFSFLIGMFVVWLIQPQLYNEHLVQMASLIIGALVLFIMGAFDDKLDLPCNFKLILETLVAIIAVMLGWKIESIMLPAGQSLSLGVLAYPLSVLWIVGITNSVNMIDGLDGLAAGISIVVAVVTLAVAGLFGNPMLVTLAIVLIGALTGFLCFNINPASIFMGDSGSLSLGFLLACITLKASAIVPGKSVILIPMLLLGLPITDTTLAIIRRVRRGIHPFHADREHIHHRLVRLGLSQSGAALVMIGISMVFGIMAYLVAQGVYTDMKLFSHFSQLP